MKRTTQKPRKLRGFAAMDPEKARQIQSKGGATVMADKEHCRKIARLGGMNSHRGDRARYLRARRAANTNNNQQ